MMRTHMNGMYTDHQNKKIMRKNTRTKLINDDVYDDFFERSMKRKNIYNFVKIKLIFMKSHN